jgi:hypothetical protein
VVSLVPFDPYLIVPELMTHKQVIYFIIIALISVLNFFPFDWKCLKTASLVEPLPGHGEDQSRRGIETSKQNGTFTFLPAFVV